MDRWSRTATPDGHTLFEETDIDAAALGVQDVEYRGKLVRQPGRGRRMVLEKTRLPDGTVISKAVGYGKSAPAPFEFADEAAIAAYSAESDPASLQRGDDDLLERYLRGDLVDRFIPFF